MCLWPKLGTIFVSYSPKKIIMKNFYKAIKSISLSLVLIFSIHSCKKEEIKGPQGDPGINGTGGNSNLSSSNVFVVDSTDWKLASDGRTWEAISNQPLITPSVVEKGVVKVYVLLSGYWWELPYAHIHDVTQYSYKSSELRLTLIDVEGAIPEKPERASYRLVVLTEAP